MDEKLSFKGINTQVAKGVAVLLLLWHHLRFGKLVENPVPSGFGVMVAFYGKVCVAIFLVLSGYGLWMSYNKKRPKTLNFYKTKIVNLMTPYWICFIIFGVLGALFFGRTLESLYGGSVFSAIINFLGLNMFFGTKSMNDAWWFISLILLFYVLFPVAFKMLDKMPAVFIVLVCASLLWRSDAFVLDKALPFLKYSSFVVDWIFAFFIGMAFAKYNLFVKIKQWNKVGVRLLIEVALLAAVMYVRYLMTMHTYYSYLKMDGFMAILIIQIMFELYEYLGPVNKVLEFFGKHSFNIYLCHSFFMSYFFWNLVYGTVEAFGLFFVVVASLASSFAIDYIHDWIKKLSKSKVKKTA